ncbi:MAG: 5-oxoprolinase subunit PxpB [Pseudomonadota bacterium]
MQSPRPSQNVRYLPAGDAALVVEFGQEIDLALSAQVMALDTALAASPPPGLIETMPSFRSLLVQFDPLVTDAGAIEEALRALETGLGDVSASGREWVLPASYGGEFGPDLADVAARTGHTEETLVADHTDILHHVYMIGFLPGCPYMGDVPAPLDLSRRETPRVHVPQGSVAIAVGLTVIYPVESPGGWNLIGRCPVPLFDPGAPSPALLAPGDRVRFEAIDPAAYDTISAAISAGEWRAEAEALR